MTRATNSVLFGAFIASISAIEIQCGGEGRSLDNAAARSLAGIQAIVDLIKD